MASYPKKCVIACILALILLVSYVPVQASSPQWYEQQVASRPYERYNRSWLISSSLVLDSKGNPNIIFSSFYYTVFFHLTYVFWNGESWEIKGVGSQYVGNQYTGGAYCLALDSKDKPHVVFFSDGGLKYASWNGSDWNYQIIDRFTYMVSDSDNKLSDFTLVLDSNNIPHVGYNGDQYASWNGTAWNIQTIKLGSFAVDSKGNLHNCINSFEGLEYFSYGDTNTTQKISEVAWSYKLTIDPNDVPHVLIYGNKGLQMASYNGVRWNIQTYNLFFNQSGFSWELDAQGNPHVTTEGKYYVWNGSVWNISEIGVRGDLQFDDNGNLHRLYFEEGNLMYASTVPLQNQGNPTEKPKENTSIVPYVLIIISLVVSIIITAVLILRIKRQRQKQDLNSD
jgi:hypothetical protein